MRGMVLRILLCLLLAAGAARAQSTTDAHVTAAEQRIEILSSRLKSVQAVIAEVATSDADLANQKGAIDSIKLDIAAEASKLTGPASEVEAQMLRLGPVPEEGATETAAIAAQRRILATRAAQLAAEQKQLELLNLEATQTLSRISVLQRDQFFARIFKSDRSVLNPRLWLDTVTGLGSIVTGIGRTLTDATRQSSSTNFGGLLLLPVGCGVAYALWTAVRRAMLLRWPQVAVKSEEQLSSLSRLWRLFMKMIGLFVAIMLVMLLLFASLDAAGILTPRLQTIIASSGNGIASALLAAGLTYFLCSPRRPEARLIAVDDRTARLLPILVGGAALAFQFGSTVSEISDTLQLPLTALAGQSAISAGAMVVLIGFVVALLQRQSRNNQAEGRSYFLTWFVRLFPVLWVLLGVAALALVLGYIALSYFIAGNILQTALFIVAMALVHNFADAVAESMQSPMTRIGQLLRRFSTLGEVGISRVALVFRTGVDVFILIWAVPSLFLIWAVTWIDSSVLYGWLLNGFTIGNISLSPWGMMVAALVLAIGVALTRAITNWLQQRVLSETTLDKGVQDSVRTVTSYAGYTIAASVALSAAGLNFSNIAIIAGALGVGIGLGLQSIVNNFVSGLILLAERPVRVGDWVATHDGEGIVKKINVRSTEIETFDNCTVIVPNSALITTAVKNWTHRDTVGRFGISVVVRPDVDAEVVAEVLKEAARSHPKVLRYPEPQVQLARFPIHGMEFEVKGHVADVFEAARVASDIRFAIAAGLKKKKISLVAA